MRYRMVGLLAMSMLLALAGCEKKGPAEQAGEKIDEAAEQAKEGMQEAADDVGDADETGGQGHAGSYRGSQERLG